MEALTDSYWIVRRMFHFLYQKRLFPLEQALLRKAGKNVGNLFTERIEDIQKYELEVKCIPIIGWNDRFSALLQRIADGKIYLRHLPIFKEEERLFTPRRFPLALVGLENSLDSLDIHVAHGEKHVLEIERARKALLELASKATGEEKRIYKRFANSLERDENFQNRITIAIQGNAEEIFNFFQLSSLGDDTPSIAKGPR